MPIHQGLQHDCDIGRAHPRRGLHHHGLVELIDRAGPLRALQPPHDRGGEHRPDALVDDLGRPVADPGHPGQPRHGLLDEHVPGPARQARRARPRHHLQRQDAVAAQLEEGLVDADALHPEHLGVDARQDLLDRVARSAVLARRVFGGRQRAGVEFAVGRQRQRVENDDRRGDHVAREPFGQRGARLGRVGDAGDVTDQAQGGGAVLAGDHHGLVDAVQRGERRLDFAEFDAVAADLDLLVGAPEVLQLAFTGSRDAPARQVAGAVHACARLTERAGHEP
ncbi:hypothetical protein MTIM_20610 [Mycobacterium timonense]|uniref:Uncharacterized protein n=1 Tax=Mycobacterium timonense TaxID=701043 RepID=A0A7I9Z5N9_9MYCO|nr:hypothetical protein MTIM_20610 [Mycobacterium timonense]